MFRRLCSWAVNLRIATKVGVCFGVLILIGLSGGVATLPNLKRIDASDQRTEQSFKILDATKTVWIHILKQESDLRGFLLSRDPSFLDCFREGDANIESALAELRHLMVKNDAQRKRIDRISALIDIWREQVFAGGKPSENAGAFGAEGVLGRILRILDDIKSENHRDLAACNEARLKALASAYWSNAVAAFAAVLAAAILGYALNRFLARPIKQITEAVQRLTAGDTNAEIPCTERREEIGAISRALTLFQRTIVEADRLRSEQLAVARRAENEREALMRSMAKRFEDIVGGVVADVSGMAAQTQNSAEALLGYAEMTTAEVQAVTGVTKQATATMRDIALGTQRLSEAVGDCNEWMAHSTSVAEQAVQEADQTTNAIRKLEGSANEIDAVVALIAGLAQQTNLLALNATIEAARAGSAGRGFSVVAGEVKGLADESSRATIQIRQRIDGIRAAASSAAEATSRISHTITEMARATHGMSSMLASQGAATCEMMRGIEASALLTADASSQLGTVNEGAAMTRQAATGMLASAKALARQSSVLSDEARRFVASVGAG